MKIIVDESPVGVGKTYRAVDLMTKTKGRYVFATERVQSMDECASLIFAAGLRNGTLPAIEKIYHGNGATGTVSRQIADLPRNTETQDHVVALISHEGLMSSDFDGFEGWTLIVDEVPCMFVMHEYRTPTDVAFFEENYTLTPHGNDGAGWHMVGLTDAGKALQSSSIAGCEGHRYLHHFHRRCRDPRTGPVVNLAKWADMAEPNREWVWWSLFHPDQISAFTTRLFLGNSFTKSLAFKLFDSEHIEWETISDLGTRPLRNRHARIVYYSDRPTSLSYLTSEAGQDDLGKIARHIAASTSQPYFWSSNGAVRPALDQHLSADGYKLPRQAGTSLLMKNHVAAMFYAAKPSTKIEQAIIGLGSDAADWIGTNEFETVLQFVTRTSVRDVSSTQDVVLHVFNSEQASYLKAFFDRQPHITATMEKVDLDLSTQTKKKGGRPRLVMTPEEREAKRIADKEKHKLLMRKKRASAKVSSL